MTLSKQTAQQSLNGCFLLVLAFLLTTHNFSVGVIVIAILIATTYLVTNRGHLTPTKRFDCLCLFILSVYFLINIPNAIIDLGNLRYFQGGIRLALCVPIYLMLINTVNNKVDIENTLNMLSTGVMIGCFGALAIALYQFFILNMTRVDGFLFSINFGYLSCSLAFLALTLLAYKKHTKMLFLAFISACIATLLTLTRGAIFAIPLLFIFIFLLRFNSLKVKHISITLISLMLLSAAAYLSSHDIQKRVTFTLKEFDYVSNDQIAKATSTGLRLELWKAAGYAFAKSPLIGLTYSQREKLNNQLYHERKIAKGVTRVERGHAHNQYFEMLASNGILGIVGFIFIFFVPIYLFSSHHRKTGSLTGYIGAVFVTGWAIFGMTEVPLTANLLGAFYGFMLAALLAMIRVEKYRLDPEKMITIEYTQMTSRC